MYQVQTTLKTNSPAQLKDRLGKFFLGCVKALDQLDKTHVVAVVRCMSNTPKLQGKVRQMVQEYQTLTDAIDPSKHKYLQRPFYFGLDAVADMETDEFHVVMAPKGGSGRGIKYRLPDCACVKDVNEARSWVSTQFRNLTFHLKREATQTSYELEGDEEVNDLVRELKDVACESGSVEEQVSQEDVLELASDEPPPKRQRLDTDLGRKRVRAKESAAVVKTVKRPQV